MKALAVLKNHGSCIISGPPGIGKSMLAEMLLLHYASMQYQIVVVSENVQEAERVYSAKSSQIFYYDDFLGRTSLAERLGKNEDARIRGFIDRVSRADNKRFILTTREYILQDAGLVYERIASPKIDYLKFVLDLTEYSRWNRAEILYNHLYFADRPTKAIESLLDDSNYKALISHPNYSPRLVEHVVKLAGPNADTSFAAFAQRTFEHPHELWKHAFESDLDESPQAVLSVLATFASYVSIDQLGEASASSRPDLFPSSAPHKFRNTLNVLEGGFISLERAGSDVVARIANPAIRDFLLETLFTVGFFRHAVSSATNFDQVQYLMGLAMGRDERRSSAGKSASASLLKDASVWSDAVLRTFNSQGNSVTRYRTSASDEVHRVFSATPNLWQRARFIAEASRGLVADEWWPEALELVAESRADSGDDRIELLEALHAASIPSEAYLPAERTMLDSALDSLNEPGDYSLAIRLARASTLMDDAAVELLEDEFRSYFDDAALDLDCVNGDEIPGTLEPLRELAGLLDTDDPRIALAEDRLREHEAMEDQREEELFEEQRLSDRSSDSEGEQIESMFESLRRP